MISLNSSFKTSTKVLFKKLSFKKYKKKIVKNSVSIIVEIDMKCKYYLLILNNIRTTNSNIRKLKEYVTYFRSNIQIVTDLNGEFEKFQSDVETTLDGWDSNWKNYAPTFQVSETEFVNEYENLQVISTANTMSSGLTMSQFGINNADYYHLFDPATTGYSIPKTDSYSEYLASRVNDNLKYVEYLDEKINTNELWFQTTTDISKYELIGTSRIDGSEIYKFFNSDTHEQSFLSKKVVRGSDVYEKIENFKVIKEYITPSKKCILKNF